VDPEPSPQFLELYKLTVEMADRTSARRGMANSFFLTLNTGLAAFLATTLNPATRATESAKDGIRLFLTAGMGFVLCFAWWISLRSYRQLNRAKFRVILEMEKQLIATPFEDEWQLLKADPLKRRFSRYAELGLVERVVPLAFLSAYMALVAGTFVS
jgi:hypothetical protein